MRITSKIIALASTLASTLVSTLVSTLASTAFSASSVSFTETSGPVVQENYVRALRIGCILTQNRSWTVTVTETKRFSDGSGSYSVRRVIGRYPASSSTQVEVLDRCRIG